jgi:serine/threonine protein kinase
MDGFDTIDEFSPSTSSAPTSRAPSSAPPRQLAKATADSFTYLKVLGQGSFGKVLLAEHKTTKEIYAIKVIKKLAVIEDDDIEATMTERRVLALSANCPFLTGLFATFQAADKLFYVMELIGGGDLMFHIQNDKVFSVPRARFYGAEICLGLWYLHSKGVIYRDLKLDNVMLDEWGHVKIADFGMCKENIFNKDKTTTFCGTPGYLAPEIINEKPYNSSVDWWSLGVLMYEMIIGDSPFDADDDDELFRQILTLKLEYPRNLDASARDVCSRFLVRDPSKRLGSDAKGADGIRAHPFFAEIDWDKLSKREIPPPFAPKRSEDKKAALNFDSDFTDEDPSISPPALRDTRQIDQALFSGFSFATQAFLESAGDAGEPADEFDEAFGTVDATPCLEDQAWFVPSMSRVEVANALRDKPIGTCLVRPSATQPGCYVLSVTVRAAAPWSGLVVPGLAGGFRIAKEHQFDTMVQLVEHYTSNPIARTIRGAPVMLRLLDPDATTAC